MLLQMYSGNRKSEIKNFNIYVILKKSLGEFLKIFNLDF